MLRGSIFIYVTVIISSMFLYNIGTIDRARYVVSHHQKGEGCPARGGGLPVDLPRPPPHPPFFTGPPHVRKPNLRFAYSHDRTLDTWLAELVPSSYVPDTCICITYQDYS